MRDVGATAWTREVDRHLADRLASFEAKIDRSAPGGCWAWTAARSSDQYGMFYVFGLLIRAHRVAYQFYVGPIPEGLQLDHLCRNRSCVNPAHLEPVTQAENIRRGEAGKATGLRTSLITQCPKGHPYDEANTYVNPQGRRSCRICKNASTNISRNRRRGWGEFSGR